MLRRPDVTMEIVDQYLHNLYRVQPDFAYSVSRDFARSCQTPMLVMPDDTPSHSYEAAMDLAALAPKAQVTEYPWKEFRGHPRPRRSTRCATSSWPINQRAPPANRQYRKLAAR